MTDLLMEYRFADKNDFDLLAEWNHQLIQDEGHRNKMPVSQLRERMVGWLQSRMYRAVLFSVENNPVAYALFRENPTEIYLRHLFVSRDHRRLGHGRKSMQILREEIWPKNKRMIVEVLTANTAAVEFWQAVGYKDYCLTMEIMPE